MFLYHTFSFYLFSHLYLPFTSLQNNENNKNTIINVKRLRNPGEIIVWAVLYGNYTLI